jgi:hypothetical protein
MFKLIVRFKRMLQTTGLKRTKTDKYYTKEFSVNLCLQLIKQHINIHKNDVAIEPSAGDGKFIPGIKQLFHHCEFYDIEPEHSEIVKLDYLTYTNTTKLTIHIIGNPPFGRQSSLAIQFIKKSCEFATTISFILPKSFKKDSLKRTFPLHFHLLAEMDLPPNSFLVNGKDHDVPCIFQIWEKKSYVREIVAVTKPIHFQFVKKTEFPDVSFRRVGVNAGVLDTNIEKNIQSHYFIKFTNNKPLQENLQRLSEIRYEDDNTVGPKSISKQELIRKFDPLL